VIMLGAAARLAAKCVTGHPFRQKGSASAAVQDPCALRGVLGVGALTGEDWLPWATPLCL